MSRKKVLVYTVPDCHLCYQTTQLLQKLKVQFDERIVSQNPEHAVEMLKKSNQTGVPVLDIDGHIVIGFSPDQIEKEIQLRK